VTTTSCGTKAFGSGMPSDTTTAPQLKRPRREVEPRRSLAAQQIPWGFRRAAVTFFPRKWQI
jgi:hypothetical protein